MYLQWGFDERGVVLVYCSSRANSVNFDRDDVYTVYVEETDD